MVTVKKLREKKRCDKMYQKGLEVFLLLILYYDNNHVRKKIGKKQKIVIKYNKVTARVKSFYL